MRPLTAPSSLYRRRPSLEDEDENKDNAERCSLRNVRRSRSWDADLSKHGEEKEIMPRKSMQLLEKALIAIEAMLKSEYGSTDWMQKSTEMGIWAAKNTKLYQAMSIADATMARSLRQKTPKIAGMAAFAKAQYARIIASNYYEENFNQMARNEMLTTAATGFRHARILETKIDKAATLGLARTLREAGDAENAIREFANLLDALNESPEASRSVALELGELLESQHRLHDAIAVYRRVMRLDHFNNSSVMSVQQPPVYYPWQHSVIHCLVRCLTKVERFSEAVAWLEQCGTPTTPQAAFRLGLVRLWARDRPKCALDAFLYAIELDPTHSDAYYYAALALLDTTNKSSSSEYISKALGAAADGLRHCLRINHTHRAAIALQAKLPSWLQTRTQSPLLSSLLKEPHREIKETSALPLIPAVSNSSCITSHFTKSLLAEEEDPSHNGHDDEYSAPTQPPVPLVNTVSLDHNSSSSHVTANLCQQQSKLLRTPTSISALSGSSMAVKKDQGREEGDNNGDGEESSNDNDIFDDLDDFDFLDPATSSCPLLPDFPDDSEFVNLLQQPQHFFFC